jgi:hypothetical protein
MEKHAKFLQGSVKKKSGGRIRCTLWIFTSFLTSLLILLLGFLVWTLVSYHQHVINLNSRVDFLETECSSYKNNINVIITNKVEELFHEVSLINLKTFVISLLIETFNAKKCYTSHLHITSSSSP